MELRPEERKLLEESTRRKCCGHLSALHCYHCCEFCEIDGCPCKWDKAECRACGDEFDTVALMDAHATACAEEGHDGRYRRQAQCFGNCRCRRGLR